MITFSRECERLLQELKKFSPETYYHCIRVKKLTLSMLWYINGRQQMFDQAKIDMICKGALLHDIGKLFVHNYLLTKRSQLTEEERLSMAQHTINGYDALEKGLSEEETQIIQDICLYHHDRIDLHQDIEEQLPLYVQIVSICDCYDALISERAYHKGYLPEEALGMIARGECGAFSPYMVDCLKNIMGEQTY